MTSLTPEQQKIVSEFEKKLSSIRDKIALLEVQREALLETFNEDYAGYLNHYAAYYDDEPLTMRQYFEAINEWDQLMEQWNELHKGIDHNDPDVDYSEIEAFERMTSDRFAHLERVLGA